MQWKKKSKYDIQYIYIYANDYDNNKIKKHNHDEGWPLKDKHGEWKKVAIWEFTLTQ
jgi:hypothetical protein